MRRLFSLVALVLIAACGGSGSNSITNPPPKVDPYVIVRLQDLLDTTTVLGRTFWHVYVQILSSDPNQAGLAFSGGFGLKALRLGGNTICQRFSEDSVGQRQIAVVAIGDTTTEGEPSIDATTAIATAWFTGNHTLPAGYKVLHAGPVDPGINSIQYANGHGLTGTDPIKWSWDLGAAALVEEPDGLPGCVF
jgi:hypothetical protein